MMATLRSFIVYIKRQESACQFGPQDTAKTRYMILWALLLLMGLPSSALVLGECAFESAVRHNRTRLPKKQSIQMTLFDQLELDELRDKLQEIGINGITPMKALSILAELKYFSD